MLGNHEKQIIAALCLAVSACSGGDQADESAGKESAATVLEYMKASNARDAEAVKAFYTKDAVTEYVSYVPPTRVEGSDKLVDGTFRESWKAFPDAHFEPVRVLVKGREVVILSLATGTNTGSIQGLPPTEEAIGILSGYHWKLDDQGKIATQLVYTDQNALPGQLGLLPEYVEFRAAEEASGNTPKIVVAKNDGTERANVDRIKKMNDAFNSHKVDAVLEFFTDSAVYSYVPAPKDRKGKKSIGKVLKETFAMSSNVKATIEWIWGAGPYVAARVVTAGINDGELEGDEPTNKNFERVELHIFKINKNSKITKQWIFANNMSLEVQLGLTPAPE